MLDIKFMDNKILLITLLVKFWNFVWITDFVSWIPMSAVDKVCIWNAGRTICLQQFFPFFPTVMSRRHSVLIFGTVGVTLSNALFFPCAFGKSGGANGGSSLHVILSRLCLWQTSWLWLVLSKNSCSSVFQRDYSMCFFAFWLLCSLLTVKIYLVSINLLFSQ